MSSESRRTIRGSLGGLQEVIDQTGIAIRIVGLQVNRSAPNNEKHVVQIAQELLR